MCGEVLTYQKSISSLPPIFYDCPQFCGLRKEPRNDFCKTCEVAAAEKDFRRDAVKALNQRCGDTWKQLGFDLLEKTVYEVASLEESDQSLWTEKTERLVNIFKNVRNKQKRIAEFRPE